MKIKIRFWNPILQNWDTFGKNGECLFEIADRGYYLSNNKELIPMISTNLKDKNGKEIFDGDIVRDNFGYLLVWWDDDFACWRFGNYSLSDLTNPKAWVSNEIEVVGNIYENPELIKETEK